MGKFKEMDLLRQEREAFDADYPMEPPPRADMWVAWNSEDGFTFWDNEQQAVLWSADKSVEWPVQYVMQKAQPAPLTCKHEWFRTGAMEPGKCRCIKCGVWNTTAAPAAQPDYAWPTIEDYEKEVGFEVNIAFRSAWAMARTTNDLFKQMGETK